MGPRHYAINGEPVSIETFVEYLLAYWPAPAPTEPTERTAP